MSARRVLRAAEISRVALDFKSVGVASGAVRRDFASELMACISSQNYWIENRPEDPNCSDLRDHALRLISRHHQGRLFDELPECLKQLRAERAVDRAMVAGKRHGHLGADFHRAVDD